MSMKLYLEYNAQFRRTANGCSYSVCSTVYYSAVWSLFNVSLQTSSYV